MRLRHLHEFQLDLFILSEELRLNYVSSAFVETRFGSQKGLEFSVQKQPGLGAFYAHICARMAKLLESFTGALIHFLHDTKFLKYRYLNVTHYNSHSFRRLIPGAVQHKSI